MSLRTILFWAGVAVVVLVLLNHPDSAGHLVHSVGDLLNKAANAVSQIAASA